MEGGVNGMEEIQFRKTSNEESRYEDRLTLQKGEERNE
jgi:hypothetical protein